MKNLVAILTATLLSFSTQLYANQNITSHDTVSIQSLKIRKNQSVPKTSVAVDVESTSAHVGEPLLVVFNYHVNIFNETKQTQKYYLTGFLEVCGVKRVFNKEYESKSLDVINEVLKAEPNFHATAPGNCDVFTEIKLASNDQGADDIHIAQSLTTLHIFP
ncbi:MAG: hypothetical protein WAW86_06475 [Gammaproteobacteria bacterium]